MSAPLWLDLQAPSTRKAAFQTGWKTGRPNGRIFRRHLQPVGKDGTVVDNAPRPSTMSIQTKIITFGLSHKYPTYPLRSQ